MPRRSNALTGHHICPETLTKAVETVILEAAPATKVLARTTSSVVTPMSFFGSYTPAAFSVSAAIGTVLFTGLLMMLMIACEGRITCASNLELADNACRPDDLGKI